MRDTIFDSYKMEIRTLSPVHVGMGQEKNYLRGLDFVVDDSKIKILNNSALLQELQQLSQIQSLTSKLATGKYQEIEPLLKPHLRKEGIVAQEYALYGNPKEDIKRQMVTGLGQTIVPGSSVKGAIRSILLADLKKKYGKQKDEKALLGRIDDNLMRFIRVTDIVFKNDDKRIYPTKIFSGDGDPLSNKGGEGQWKHAFSGGHEAKFKIEGFESYYEAIKSGSTGSLTIQLGGSLPEKLSLFATSSTQKKDGLLPNVVNYKTVLHNKKMLDILSIIRSHTKIYIEKEIEYYTKFNNDFMGQAIINRLKKYLDDNESSNSCVLRVGAGVGFHSITGNWQDVSDDHFSSWVLDDGSVELKDKSLSKTQSRLRKKNQIFAKTRKIAITQNAQNQFLLFPMGFIKLTLQNP